MSDNPEADAMTITAKHAFELEVGDSIFVWGYHNNLVSKAESIVSIEPASAPHWLIVKTVESEVRYLESELVDYIVRGPRKPVWSWDDDVESGYLTIRDGPISYTREVAPCVLIDYDENGNALGVEII